MSTLGRILLVEDDPKDVELTLDFHEFVNAIKELGIFWAIINQPPPGSITH